MCMNSALKIIGIYLIVFIISVVMAFLKMNFYIALSIIVMIAFFGLIFPLLNAVLWETDVKKIEKFLKNKKKNPYYNLIYALANNLDNEVEEATNILLKKYQQKHRQALFKTIYALYKKEISIVKQEIEHIKPVNYRQYYQAIILIEEENFSDAKQLINQISIPWMKSALLSDIENKLRNNEKAMCFAKEALKQAKGLQKYILYKTYQRDFPTL